jgi:tRNA-dihydrouridine synthase A
VLGLFRGVPGARAFRRHLATEAVKASANAETFRDALALIDIGQAARQTVDTVAA